MSGVADIHGMARRGDLEGLTDALRQGNVDVNKKQSFVRMYIIHATFLCV